LFKLSFLSFGGANGWVYVMESCVMVVAKLMVVGVVGVGGWVCVMVVVKRKRKRKQWCCETKRKRK